MENPIEVRHGKRGNRPVLRGTRIPICILEDYIERYDSPADSFCREYPDVDRDLVEAAIRKIT